MIYFTFFVVSSMLAMVVFGRPDRPTDRPDDTEKDASWLSDYYLGHRRDY